MAITYIDFYAENPIENKTIADSCIFENINGDGSALWTIYNSNDITITAEDTLYLNADRMWFNSSVEWTTIVSNSGMGFTTNPNSSGYSFTWNANGGKWDVDTKGGDIIFNTYNSSTLTYGAMVFPPVDKLQIAGGSNGQVLTTDGSAGLSWTTASGGGVADADYGNITVSGSGSVWTIDNSVVSYAKIQNVSTNNRLLGRSTASAGVVEEITIGSGLTLTAGTLTASGGGASVYDVQTFNASNTWTKPAGALFVEIWVIGAGTGGGSGRRGSTTTNRCGGAGGGGNTWACFKVNASTLGSTASVTIGAGGLGGASVTTDDTNGNIGNIGGETRFVSGTYRTNYYNNNSYVQGGTTSTTSQPGKLTQNVMPWGMYLAYIPNFQTFGIEPGSGRTTIGSQTFIYFADQGNGFNSNLGGGGGGGAVANSSTSAEGGFSQNMSTDSEFTTLYANGGSPTGTRNGGVAVSGMNWVLPVSTGGGGGAFRNGFAGGNGGNGLFGSGGGGGGASSNTYNSGAGGNGGNGCIVVISYG